MEPNLSGEIEQKDALLAFDSVAAEAIRWQRELYKEQENCKLLENSIKQLDAKFLAVSNDITKTGSKKENSLKKEKILQTNIDSIAKSKQLVDELNSDLRRQLQYARTQNDINKQKDATTISKYATMWDSYEAVYLQFPLAAERHKLTVQTKRDKIRVAQSRQDLKDMREKIATMKTIKALQTQIAVHNMARLFVLRNKHAEDMTLLQKSTKAAEDKIAQLRREKQDLFKRTMVAPKMDVRAVVTLPPLRVAVDAPLASLKLPKFASPPRKVRCFEEIRLAADEIYSRLPQRLFAANQHLWAQRCAAAQDKTAEVVTAPPPVAPSQCDPPALSQPAESQLCGVSNPPQERTRGSTAPQALLPPSQEMADMPMRYSQEKQLAGCGDNSGILKKKKLKSALECATPRPGRRNVFKPLHGTGRPGLTASQTRDPNTGSVAVGNNAENMQREEEVSQGLVTPGCNSQSGNDGQPTDHRQNTLQTLAGNSGSSQREICQEAGLRQNASPRNLTRHSLVSRMSPRLRSETRVSFRPLRQSQDQASTLEDNASLGNNSQEDPNTSLRQSQEEQNASHYQSQEEQNVSLCQSQEAQNVSLYQSQEAQNASLCLSQEAQNASPYQSQEAHNTSRYQSQVAQKASHYQSQEAQNASPNQSQEAHNTSLCLSQEAHNTSRYQYQAVQNASHYQSQEAQNASPNQSQEAHNTSRCQSQVAQNASHYQSQVAQNASPNQSQEAHNTSRHQSQVAENASLCHSQEAHRSRIQSQETPNALQNQSQEALNTSLGRYQVSRLSSYDEEAHWAYLRKLKESPERVYQPMPAKRSRESPRTVTPTTKNLEHKEVFHSHYFLQSAVTVQTNNSPRTAEIVRANSAAAASDNTAANQAVSDKTATNKVSPAKKVVTDKRDETATKEVDHDTVATADNVPLEIVVAGNKIIYNTAVRASVAYDNDKVVSGNAACDDTAVEEDSAGKSSADNTAADVVAAEQDATDKAAASENCDENGVGGATGSHDNSMWISQTASTDANENGVGGVAGSHDNSMWISQTASTDAMDVSYGQFTAEMNARMESTDVPLVDLDANDTTMNESFTFQSPIVSPIKMQQRNPFGDAASSTAGNLSGFNFNFGSALTSTSMFGGNNQSAGQQPGQPPSSDMFNFNFSNKPATQSIFKLF